LFYKNPINTKKCYSECLLRLGVLWVFELFCVFVFVRAIFVIVPSNFTCLHSLQHSFLELLFILYMYTAEHNNSEMRIQECHVCITQSLVKKYSKMKMEIHCTRHGYTGNFVFGKQLKMLYLYLWQGLFISYFLTLLKQWNPLP